MSSNPRGGNQPGFDPALHPNYDPGSSLVEGLGSIVDDARQIAVDLGMRPYRTFSVVYRWSGGEIGRGTATVASELEFLPSPEVVLTPVYRTILSGGQVERGRMTLREISPRLTEEQIETLCYGPANLRGPGLQSFVEITMDRRDGDRAKRRRFGIVSAPYRDVERMQWTVDLLRQDQDRLPNGMPASVGMRDDTVFFGGRR